MAGRSKAALQKAIDADKAKLQESLNQLGQAVQEEVDPRRWLARSPYASLSIGFGVGMVLALVRGSDASL